MIWMVLKTQARRLRHNRSELLLAFVVPVVFFSIFAVIFGRGVGTTPKIKIAMVNETTSTYGAEVVQSIGENPGVRLMSNDPAQTINRMQASERVRRGSVSMAVVIHEQDSELAADLLSDTSDQVASQVVLAIVTRELAIENAKQSRDAAMVNRSGPRGNVIPASFPVPTRGSPVQSLDSGQPRVQLIDVIGTGKSNPVVSMYAAGIAVMFLLFSATAGGGSLLEERENQTLDRLLSTQLTMDQLLLGKWFFLTAVGIVQVTIMFVWGQLVFGVDLLGHLDGFLMMTIVTAAAASAFGLFLATLCRTRGQLNGLSVILILTMSALGGSMIPRYVMSPELRDIGLWTFNAWALDGYDKVFWRDLPVAELAPQLGVLLTSAVGFLVVARLLAIRWETA